MLRSSTSPIEDALTFKNPSLKDPDQQLSSHHSDRENSQFSELQENKCVPLATSTSSVTEA